MKEKIQLCANVIHIVSLSLCQIVLCHSIFLFLVWKVRHFYCNHDICHFSICKVMWCIHFEHNVKGSDLFWKDFLKQFIFRVPRFWCHGQEFINPTYFFKHVREFSWVFFFLFYFTLYFLKSIFSGDFADLIPMQMLNKHLS